MLSLALPKLALAIALAAVAAPTPYSNPDYGFRLDPPRNRTLCMDDPPAPNRGAFFLLEESGACPFAMSGESAFIWVSAAHNELEYPSLKALADARCDAGSARRYDAADLHFPGTASVACRSIDRHGFIHVEVLAFRKQRQDRSLGKAAGDWIVFQASLTTTQKRLKQDLGTFRTTLRSVRFSPAP